MKALIQAALLPLLLHHTTAATIDIVVGPGPTDPKFTPDVVQAQPGDILAYHFGAGHDISHGSFEAPCEPVQNSFWSGEPGNGSVFNIQVNDTQPLWIYCSVPGHCQLGMAMVVNPPSNESLQAYKDAAASVTSSSGRPTVVAGGIFSTAQNSSDSGPATTSPASGMSSAAPSSTPTGNSGAQIAVGGWGCAGVLAGAVAMLL